jgi:hypothetical protein
VNHQWEIENKKPEAGINPASGFDFQMDQDTDAADD